MVITTNSVVKTNDCVKVRSEEFGGLVCNTRTLHIFKVNEAGLLTLQLLQKARPVCEIFQNFGIEQQPTAQAQVIAFLKNMQGMGVLGLRGAPND